MSQHTQKINAEGLAIIKHFEGLRLIAYRCPAGVWTIGYGHTEGVKEGDIITTGEAERLLLVSLKAREKAVSTAVKVPLTSNQFSAMVSLVYNIGVGAFQNSTLLRLLNQGDYQGAADQFARWRLSRGKVLGGLVARREVEKKLFLKPDVSQPMV